MVIWGDHTFRFVSDWLLWQKIHSRFISHKIFTLSTCGCYLWHFIINYIVFFGHAVSHFSPLVGPGHDLNLLTQRFFYSVLALIIFAVDVPLSNQVHLKLISYMASFRLVYFAATCLFRNCLLLGICFGLWMKQWNCRSRTNVFGNYLWLHLYSEPLSIHLSVWDIWCLTEKRMEKCVLLRIDADHFVLLLLLTKRFSSLRPVPPFVNRFVCQMLRI